MHRWRRLLISAVRQDRRLSPNKSMRIFLHFNWLFLLLIVVSCIAQKAHAQFDPRQQIQILESTAGHLVVVPKYKEAIEKYKLAIMLSERVYGRTSTITARAYGGLANMEKLAG